MSTEQYPLPIHEAKRLQALQAYALLNTPREPDFDAALRLLAHSVRVPMAWLGLIDSDRVWTKASVGAVPEQLPRDAWVATHLVAHPREYLAAENLADEARWPAHPWHGALSGCQFLAAMPVVDAAGQVLHRLALGVDGHHARRRDAFVQWREGGPDQEHAQADAQRPPANAAGATAGVPAGGCWRVGGGPSAGSGHRGAFEEVDVAHGRLVFTGVIRGLALALRRVGVSGQGCRARRVAAGPQ